LTATDVIFAMTGKTVFTKFYVKTSFFESLDAILLGEELFSLQALFGTALLKIA
jgi:hypothetical protein